MSGSRSAAERRADEVIRADLAAQGSITAVTKGPPVPPGATLVSPPVGTERNRTVIALAVIALLALVSVGAAFALLGGQPTPSPTSAGAVATASPTAVTETPVVSSATPASTTQPTPQTASPPPSTTTAPTVAPSTLAAQTVPPAAVQPVFIDQQVSMLTNGTLAILDSVPALQLDTASDTYLPDSGRPAVADQPYIDLFGAAAFLLDLEPGPATALSAHACDTASERDGSAWHTACNQPGPMPSGQYMVVVSYWAQPIPDPFPQRAQCVYIVQADVDDDRATGFQSQLPFNHLVGADVYYENLFFWDQAGDFRNYILATDHARPPRPDTGEIHGNVGTLARWFASGHAYDSSDVLVQSAWIPVDGIGDTLSVGGFCINDRSAPGPDALSVDALGDPGTAPFPTYFGVAGVP